MGNVHSVGFSIFGIEFRIYFKGDEVTSKDKIQAFLIQTGIDVVNVLRKNDDQVDEYFTDNNIKKLKSTAEITGWVEDLSDA